MAIWLEALEEGRCRKWKLRWSRGRGSSRIQRSETFEGGKREAKAALKAFGERCDAIPTEEESFRLFAERWNDNRLASDAIADRTHAKYRVLIRMFAKHLPEKVGDVKSGDVVKAYAALKSGDGGSIRAWSGTSLRTAHNALCCIFDAACKNGLAQSNPCDSVDPPKGDTRRRKALAPADTARLLKILDASDAREFAVSMMLRTGMRPGECVNVAWGDVSGGCINIRRDCTKTAAGVRSIPLDEDTMRFVGDRRDYVEKMLAQASDTLSGAEMLCCTEDGRPLSYNALRLWWERHRAEFGMDGWVLHELRHTYITNLAQAKVHPSVMSRLAGHSSTSLAMEIYTHVNADDMREAVESLASARQCTPKCTPSGSGKENQVRRTSI